VGPGGLKGDRRGAVYVEFLIVVIPFLSLLFGITQIGLLYGAHLMVCHAAAKSARAAIVILPDDHEDSDYAGVPVNHIGNGGEGLDAYSSAPDGGRLDAIRMAPMLILSAVSPSIESVTGNSLADAIGEAQFGGYLAGLLWTEVAMAVTFPDGDGGYRTSFDATGPVTARVTFLYKCTVPMVNSLVCGDYDDLEQEQKRVLETAGGILPILGTITGWQVIALEAERTLPNQGKSHG